MKNENIDIIIIGAGLGGLTAGAYLSSKRLKVLVIEQHDKAGGFATKFKRKDFTFDVSLHNFGPLYDNLLIKKILTELNIIDKLDFIPFDNYQRMIFPETDLIVEKGVGNYIKILKKIFPLEGKGIDIVFNEMIGLKKEFDEIENLDIPINKLEEEFPMLPVKFPSLVKLVFTTFGQLLEKNIKDEKLKGIIGALWWLYGIPPDRVASILYSVPSMNYYDFSGGYIKGTSQRISDLLVEKIKENGGDILLNTKIKKIFINDNKAAGIVTDKNEIINAKFFISNITPAETFNNLIGEGKVDKNYLKKINRLQYSLSCIQLYLGLNCVPETLGFNNHNITVYTSYDQNENYQFAVNGDYNKIFYSATDYSNFNDDLKSKNKGILNIMSLDSIKNWENLSKEEYKKKKTEVIDILIKRLEDIVPDIKKHIEVAELATPLTVKRYTGHPDGSIYGTNQIVEQSGINRLSPETPIENLFLCGANIYPGAGFSSVISAGYKVSKKIIKEKIK